MTHSEVINKLSMEMALSLGDLDTLPICRMYIQMAVVVGTEHFTRDSDEIICLKNDGEEFRRFKSIREAAAKLGIDRRNINHVLKGEAHSAGGFLFIRSSDREQIKLKVIA